MLSAAATTSRSTFPRRLTVVALGPKRSRAAASRAAAASSEIARSGSVGGGPW